jgi:hypothetical protein
LFSFSSLLLGLGWKKRKRRVLRREAERFSPQANGDPPEIWEMEKKIFFGVKKCY